MVYQEAAVRWEEIEWKSTPVQRCSGGAVRAQGGLGQPRHRKACVAYQKNTRPAYKDQVLAALMQVTLSDKTKQGNPCDLNNLTSRATGKEKKSSYKASCVK